jgi:hypothetical protein
MGRVHWCFHRVSWAGWISTHNRRKRAWTADAHATVCSRPLLVLGVLGFTSVYREGFDFARCRQELRLQVGLGIVLVGVLIGLCCSAIVVVLTCQTHRRLPYRGACCGVAASFGVRGSGCGAAGDSRRRDLPTPALIAQHPIT